MKIKFSIITCTYNSEKYIQDNIKSVKNQTFKNFEHVFIDGFSTDKTIEIIKKYQKEFPKKVRIFQIPPKGISNAMNEGIKKSTGNYLIHVHSDDYLYNNKVLKDTDTFLKLKNYPDWIYGKIRVLEEDNSEIGIFPNYKFLHFSHKSKIGKYLIKYLNFIPHQAVFIKKTVFNKYGYFDESIKSIMDLDLWIRITKNTKWLFTDKIICNYKIRPDAQSSGNKNTNTNRINLKIVQKRYMNTIELFFSTIINKIIIKLNKTKR